jgi:hypothetical protein
LGPYAYGHLHGVLVSHACLLPKVFVHLNLCEYLGKGFA